MGGRKRRFLLFGVVNVLLTNGALLLLLHLVTIGLATFLSQLLNVVLETGARAARTGDSQMLFMKLSVACAMFTPMRFCSK